ncbi:hypothetical protein [Nitrosospira sp. NpAV]|uniref:hypothetical protein n=1 Tax=Nitrosospira sp. NpAV TaxID=58133 RepID=UPI0005A156E1|nr:hypothetical protein [Nitrosospira sp. NpAV]KIO48278.1 hypothetical protein SQ11_12455 [Nitrosospira sp. NpAV]
MNEETATPGKNKQEVIPVPTLDCDAYREDLTEFELTTEQENELLSILWDIMRTMCDLNLDMDAVQMIMPTFLYAALNEDKNDQTGKAAQPFNQSAEAGNSERSKPNG